MRLAELIVAAALASASASAQTSQSPDAPLAADEIQMLSTDAEQLTPCVNDYMGSHPLDETVGARLIGLGLAAELKDRALAVISPASGDHVSMSGLDATVGADVANMLALLAQDLSASADAIDPRPNVLGQAVFNYFLARLAGETCSIDPAMEALLPRARYDRLTRMPGIEFDGLKLQREVDQAALCAFGHMPAEDREGDKVNLYIAQHGDVAQLQKDAEDFAARLDEAQATKAATDYLAELPADSSPADQVARYMGLLVGSEHGDDLPPATRYRAAALSAYHLARASEGSCKLGPASLQLIGKEN